MLFISLSYAFFRDFNVSPIVSPLEVVFISPTRGSISRISGVLLVVLSLVLVWLYLFDVLLQLPLLDESLHLVFQMFVLIRTMPVVLMESTVLALVSSF